MRKRCFDTNKLDSIWKGASRYFPLCYVHHKGNCVELNVKNRIQYVLSQICINTELQLPPVKINGQCIRVKIINSFFSVKQQ